MSSTVLLSVLPPLDAVWARERSLWAEQFGSADDSKTALFRERVLSLCHRHRLTGSLADACVHSRPPLRSCRVRAPLQSLFVARDRSLWAERSGGVVDSKTALFRDRVLSLWNRQLLTGSLADTRVHLRPPLRSCRVRAPLHTFWGPETALFGQSGLGARMMQRPLYFVRGL